jgi:hypothetical protein
VRETRGALKMSRIAMRCRRGTHRRSVRGCRGRRCPLIGVFASSASAQNPFLIDGTVTDASNSKAVSGADKDTEGHLSAKKLGPCLELECA